MNIKYNNRFYTRFIVLNILVILYVIKVLQIKSQ